MIKDIFKSWKVITLIIFLVFAYFSINGGIIPQFGNEGVAIRSVTLDSAAAAAGMVGSSSKTTPLQKERIIAVNGQRISNVEEFYSLTSTIPLNTTVQLKTNKQTYTLVSRGTDLGVRVYDAPSTNLRKGLDLEGGTRVLLQPAEKISSEDFDSTVASLEERLNVYGLSDVIIRKASDLKGDDFILVEIAGVTEQEVKELIASQGKFESKIGNQTVFSGGDKDIRSVCRSASCSGIDPSRACQGSVNSGYQCGFYFTITVSPEAAKRQADITRTLQVVEGSYLSQNIDLYLDDVLVDSLRIGADLRGREEATQIQITGSGEGLTQQDAIDNTLDNMKKLQTIIVTGSLPTKLEIVKLDTVSPSLGHEFLDNILLVGLLAILSVIFFVYLRYRQLKVVVPMVLTLLSEMVLILGFAALVGWNLDLAGIAGIIIVAGTGVDHLIVITDETLRGEKTSSWKQRIKNAMFIVMGAYLTTLAGMLPLLWAGAGLLKGFALTTIAGISFGVLIARPAYAAIIEKLLGE